MSGTRSIQGFYWLLVGTALAVGKWRAVIAFFVILIVYILKARKEENLLASQLGASYLEYMEATGMLLPKWK